MNRDQLISHARFVGDRVFTFLLYLLAVLDASSWDRNPDSWFWITFRLFAAAGYLWWAVGRTIRHWHADHPAVLHRKEAAR